MLILDFEMYSIVHIPMYKDECYIILLNLKV